MKENVDKNLVGALKDAANDTEELFQKMIGKIDNQFGPGYAKEHPELVGSLVQSASNQAVGYLQASEIKEALENISYTMQHCMHLTVAREREE